MSEDKNPTNKKSKAPVLLPKKDRIIIPDGKKKSRPPYILILIIVLAVLGAFWKSYMASKNERGASAPVSSLK